MKQRARIWLVFTALSLTVAPVGAVEAEKADPPALDFAGAFFQNHCLVCHGADAQEGDFDLRPLLAHKIGADQTAEAWLRVLGRVATGNMPPEGEPRPGVMEVGHLVQSVRKDLVTAGKGAALAFPDKGNLIPHAVLFAANQDATAATPARVWRISPQQYTALSSTMSGRRYKPEETSLGIDKTLPAPFSLRGGTGLQDYSFLYRIDEAQAEQLVLNARVLAQQTLAGKGNKLLARSLLPLAEQKEALSAEQVQQSVQDICLAVLSRSPTESEAARYGDYLHREVRKFDNKTGLENAVAAVLLNPHALFRIELGRDEPDEHGRVMLTPHEIADALAYAFSDTPPDNRLQEAARNGRLETREDVHAHAERMLNDSRLAKPRLIRFFREFFGYDAAPEVFKDEDLLKPEVRVFAVLDTDRLVLRALERDQEVLRYLLTTNESFVMIRAENLVTFREKQKQGITHPFDRKNHLNEVYNVAAEDWTIEQPMEMPKQQRAGVLMQPSWLIAHSTNDANDAIHRGKWIRERLLGDSIPDTPITVEAKLPHEPESTLRHRMRVTREEYCWKCHQRMDPLGLPLEMFDHWGRYRTEELGEAVNTSGAIYQAAHQRLEGPVSGPIELMQRLGSSEHVEQVFVRHAFRFWLGRNETPEDAPTLQAAWQAYRDNGGSMKAMLTSLLTSDSFLYRIPMN